MLVTVVPVTVVVTVTTPVVDGGTVPIAEMVVVSVIGAIVGTVVTVV